MSFRAMVLKRSCLAAILFSLGASTAAFGQAKDAPVSFSNQDAITTSMVDPPIIPGASNSSSAGSSTAQWLKVEIHFGTTANLTTDFLDSVDIKVWIEARDTALKNTSGGQGAAIVLTGTVTYVNIPNNSKDLYGVFYVHPSTLARYAGEGGLDNFDRKFNVHAQLLVGGKVQDDINKNKEKPEDELVWFTALKAVPNLVYRQDQSPFVVTDVGRYPAIKLQASSQ